MSTLVINTLEAGAPITQDFRIKRSLTLKGVRVSVVKSGAFNGIVTIRIKQGATVLKEVSLTSASIHAAIASNFAYGSLYFELDKGMRMNHASTSLWTEYQLEIEHSSNSIPDTYLALIKEYSDRSISVYPSEPNCDLDHPHTFQLIEWK